MHREIVPGPVSIESCTSGKMTLMSPNGRHFPDDIMKFIFLNENV